MPELDFLTAYLEEDTAAAAGTEAKAGKAAEAAPKAAEEKAASNLTVRDADAAAVQNPAPSSGGLSKISLKAPGQIGGLLLLILFIVLAIMPAFPGANITRLTLLWNALVRGGAFKGEEAASASPVTSNGSGYDAYIQQPSPYDMTAGSSYWNFPAGM